jgi:molybdopterin-guanine dinucleotide biosynthesis protein A
LSTGDLWREEMMGEKIAAVILAGGTPETTDLKADPLLEYAQVQKKPLIKIAGKEMIRYVVEAIASSSRIGRIFIVGLSPEDGGVEFAAPVEYVEAAGSMLDNVVAGIEQVMEVDPDVEWVVLSTADIPLLKTEMVDYLIATCLETDHDVYYTVVEKSTMEARFPGSRRSFVPLRGGSFAGGDINMAKVSAIQANLPLARQAMEFRKNFWQQVRLLGFGTLIKFAFRRLTIADAERVASRALGCQGRAIITPYPEMGMDVDKPHQLDMVRDILEGGAA